MNELRLRFCDGEQPDLALGAGMHSLGRLPTGLGPVEDGQAWLLQVCNDRRGIWLTVADDLRGVHVNGRPIRHVAMLRAGDSIHVDGDELMLTAANDPAVLPASTGASRDPVASLRLVLRGIGGLHHGRSISLDRPRWIGRGADADIRIDAPGIADRHALVESVHGQALLRDAQAEVMVNGHRIQQTVLRPGDQIAFDVQHRFVVEGPPPSPAGGTQVKGARHPGEGHDVDAGPVPRTWHSRMPWLQVAALLLAAALSGLLLFGAR